MTTLSGQLLLTNSNHQATLCPGTVRVDQGMISEVVEGEIAASADNGHRNALLCPGFIDCHLHLPQFWMIGAHGMSLLDWLAKVTFPAEQRWSDPGYARQMTASVLRNCLSVGTTSFCAYGSVHHQATIEALTLAKQMGFRAAIGQVLMDRGAPAELCRSKNQLFDEASRTLQLFPAEASVSAAVTPRFAISCSAELLAGAGSIAQDHGAIVQTHLAETRQECQRVTQLFGGLRYVDVYAQASLLHARSILGHGIHLDSDDLKQLAARDAIIAHCPTANSFLCSGTMNRRFASEHAVRTVLGSDIGAGYERSMIRVARASIEAAASLAQPIPDASSVWYDITTGAADAIGWNDVGKIEVGRRADLLVIEPDLPWLDSSVDPLSILLFAWDDRWIKKTLLRGQTA